MRISHFRNQLIILGLGQLKDYYYYSMKSFSRVQKKGILSARAIENNRLNNSLQNFDEMVEKQLEDDFKVHEYLNQNPNEGHNTEEYIALLNTLLVKKFNKMQRKELLKSSKAQLQPNDRFDHQNQSKSKQKRQVDAYYSEEEYLKIKQESEAQQEIIEEKTQQELEMKSVLLKEISQNKKSLNLLKGDIGHMITRNQSISVLQSKVNKVSLVSENQLKRVSLALTKDKEQVQLRQEMQKKFHSKLKAVESLESRGLKKIKLSYIETMKRRKQIFDNLNLIQKQCASIEEYSDKQKQKDEKNYKSLALFRLLNFANQSIAKSATIWRKFEQKQITCLEYCKQLGTLFKYEAEGDNKLQSESLDMKIEQINEERLEMLKEGIIRQFWRLENQIREKKNIYRQHMARIEQLWVKIGHCDKKGREVLNQFTKQERNELSFECFSVEQYFRKLSHLKSNFNILYSLISYFTQKGKSSSGKQLINQIYRNQSFHARIMQSQEEKSGYDELLFSDIQAKLSLWFSNLLKKVQIWNSIPESTREELENKCKRQVQFNFDKFAETDAENFSHSQRLQVDEAQQNSSSDENENECNRALNQLNEQEKSFNKGTKTTICASKHTNQEETAKRIQILTKIDQSYYRMIKETIQMEKENTMKNYQFKRSFKRNKYSSQDQLLEEKRFEATFSSLFKQDSDNATRPSKLKHESFKIKKALTGKSIFSSVHQTKNNVSLHNSFSEVRNKNSSFWEKQKKLRLRSKLKDVLSRT